MKETEESKQLPDAQSSDENLEETKSTVVAPPRKNKRFHEKEKNASIAESATSVQDQLLVQVEEIKTEAQTPTLSLEPVTEVSKNSICEEISLLPSRRKSKSLDTEKEPVHTEVESELGKSRETLLGDIASSEPKTKFEASGVEAISPVLHSQTTDAKSEQNQEDPKNTPSVVTAVNDLPPRRKPKSPKCPPKYPEQQEVQTEPTKVSHGDSKLIPIRRKSKTAIPAATSLQIAFDGLSTEVETEDNKTTPVTLEYSDDLRKTEMNESTDVKKDKPSPTKRKSKVQKTLAKDTSETRAESQPKPSSDNSLQEHKVFVDTTVLIPSCQKEKNLEIHTASVPVYSASTMPGGEPEETQQEMEKYSATETFTVQTDNAFLPPKRKSKKIEPCLVQVLQMKDEPEGHKSFLFELNKNESLSQESSPSDEPLGSTELSLNKNMKPSPSNGITASLKPLQDPFAMPGQDILVEPEGHNPLEGIETTILTDTELIAIRRNSPSSDISAAVQPVTEGTDSLESNKTERELESLKNTDQRDHKISPNTRSKSPVRCQEHLSKEESEDIESCQITEGTVVLQTQLTSSDSLPLVGPQMDTTEKLATEIISLLPETTEESKYPRIVVPNIPEITSAYQESESSTENEERVNQSEVPALVAQLDESQTEAVVADSVKIVLNKGKSEGLELSQENLTDDKIPTHEEHDSDRLLPPSVVQIDVNLVGMDLRQTREDLTRVEPSAGPESLCADETHTDVVTKHPTDEHNILKPTTAVKMITPITEKGIKNNQIETEDISPEKKVSDTEADMSASLIIPNTTSDTLLQESEYKANETPKQTISQCSQIDLGTFSKVQVPFSSDFTDVSVSLQTETMTLGTGGMETNEIRKEPDRARASSTKQSDELTTDQKEFEFLTTKSSKSYLVNTETSYKEDSLTTIPSDGQTAEADVELMYFREQPGIIASVINEQNPDKTESQNLSKSDTNETQSQSEEAILKTRDGTGQPTTAEVGLKWISVNTQESTNKAEQDSKENNIAVEKYSEEGKEIEVRIPKDQALKVTKVATIILDANEELMDKGNSFLHELDTCTISPHAKELVEDTSASSVRSYQESESRPKISPQQKIPHSSERDLNNASIGQLSLSSDSTDAPNITDYIQNLWKNTDNIEKRYLILDVPGKAMSQIDETELNQLDKESVGKHISNRLISDVCTIALSQEGSPELTEEKVFDDETVKLSGTVREQKESESETRSHERSKELKESDVNDIKDIKEERSQKEPVCILHLDIATSAEVPDKTSVIRDGTRMDHVEANIQQDIHEKVSGETKPSALEAVLEHRTEFIEISFHEQDQIHQIEPERANKHSIPDEPTLLMQRGMAKSQKLPESCVLQLDIQCSPEKNETTSVQEEKDTFLDIDETHNQSEKNIVAIIPEEATTELSGTEMHKTSTQILGSFGQGDSVQLCPVGYESLHPHNTRVIEITLDDKAIETKTELLTTEQEKPGLGTEHSFRKVIPEMSTGKMNAFSENLGEKSEEAQNPQMEPEEQVATQTAAEEEEEKIEEPEMDQIRAESQQTDSSQQTFTPLPSCDADTVLGDRRATELDYFQTEEVIRQDIWRGVQDRAESLPQHLNETYVAEKGQQDTQMPKTPSSFSIAEVPSTALNETSVQGQKVMEKQDLLSLDAYPEDMTTVEDVKQPGQQESVESVIPGEDNNKKSQDDYQLEPYKDELPGVDKDPSVAEPPEPSINDVHVASNTFYKVLDENREIVVSPFEDQIADSEKQEGMEPCIKYDKGKESLDGAAAKGQPDGSAFERIKDDIQEIFTLFVSEPSLVQTDKHSTDATEKIGEQQVRESEEGTVGAELLLQTPADDIKLPNVNLPKVSHSKTQIS